MTQVAGQGGAVFLLSAGADKRLCLWDITRGVLVGCYNEKGIEEVRWGPEMSWGEIGGGCSMIKLY